MNLKKQKKVNREVFPPPRLAIFGYLMELEFPAAVRVFPVIKVVNIYINPG